MVTARAGPPTATTHDTAAANAPRRIDRIGLPLSGRECPEEEWALRGGSVRRGTTRGGVLGRCPARHRAARAFAFEDAVLGRQRAKPIQARPLRVPRPWDPARAPPP